MRDYQMLFLREIMARGVSYNRAFTVVLMKYVITILLVFAGIAMIGQGARMLTQGVFFPNSVYKPVMFDLFFDWLTLLVLGIGVFVYGVWGFYTGRKARSS